MICEQWCDKLDAYVDEAEGDFAGLEEHLRSCPSCAAEVLSRVRLARNSERSSSRRCKCMYIHSRSVRCVEAEGPPTFRHSRTWMAPQRPC